MLAVRFPVVKSLIYLIKNLSGGQLPPVLWRCNVCLLSLKLNNNNKYCTSFSSMNQISRSTFHPLFSLNDKYVTIWLVDNSTMKSQKITRPTSIIGWFQDDIHWWGSSFQWRCTLGMQGGRVACINTIGYYKLVRAFSPTRTIWPLELIMNKFYDWAITNYKINVILTFIVEVERQKGIEKMKVEALFVFGIHYTYYALQTLSNSIT